jgi:N-glycosylase/DNA lyase
MIETLDFQLCLTSGQVFGWKKVGENWIGCDGPRNYCLASLSDIHYQDAGLLFGFHIILEDGLKTILEADPKLATTAEKLKGLRLMQPRSFEQTLFTFLCTQNNHLPRIEKMVQSLLAFSQTGFPPAALIADIGEERLRELGFGYRAESIVKVAKILAKDEKIEENLRSLSYPEARKALMELPGIGPKLADCIALYGLHHLEAVPVDTHLWQAVVQRYRPEWISASISAKRYWEIGEILRDKFGEWAGYAQLLLYYGHMQKILL